MKSIPRYDNRQQKSNSKNSNQECMPHKVSICSCLIVEVQQDQAAKMTRDCAWPGTRMVRSIGSCNQWVGLSIAFLWLYLIGAWLTGNDLSSATIVNVSTADTGIYQCRAYLDTENIYIGHIVDVQLKDEPRVLCIKEYVNDWIRVICTIRSNDNIDEHRKVVQWTRDRRLWIPEAESNDIARLAQLQFTVVNTIWMHESSVECLFKWHLYSCSESVLWMVQVRRWRVKLTHRTLTCYTLKAVLLQWSRRYVRTSTHSPEFDRGWACDQL